MPLLIPKMGLLYDTLLEAIGIMLETYFRFGFPNSSSIGDSLTARYNPSSTTLERVGRTEAARCMHMHMHQRLHAMQQWIASAACPCMGMAAGRFDQLCSSIHSIVYYCANGRPARGRSTHCSNHATRPCTAWAATASELFAVGLKHSRVTSSP